jgi:ubiquinone/menaquinone biosynthesis C-methylase UbiE
MKILLDSMLCASRSKSMSVSPVIIGGMSEQEHLKWQDFWDQQAKVGDSYQAVRGDKVMPDDVQKYHDRKLVDLVSPEPGDWLLDAGCGVGDQTIMLSPLVKQITAIDFSPVMTDRCSKCLKKAGVSNATTETADVTALPHADDTYDKALSIAVVQYLNPKEVDKAIAELARVIKSDGVLVLHFKDLWSGTGMMITLGRFLRALFKGRPELEYQYRTHWWYKKKLRNYGIIEESYAYGTWTPFMPRKMMSWIAIMEIRHRFWQNRWPHGKEYFIRTRIRNGG